MTDESHALRVIPVTLEVANEFVRRLHRHSRPVTGSKFAVGVELVDSVPFGAKLVGGGDRRPSGGSETR